MAKSSKSDKKPIKQCDHECKAEVIEEPVEACRGIESLKIVEVQ
ncbi:MAG: hypothetical protein OIN66_18460 [Candidatus Methanoperedens sp.]|nr:hypothetical protein [Candidatus Methanoperedens sp.]